MLAQNFQSHTDLGITEAEHSALVSVLGMLERDELTLARKLDALNYEPTSERSFHMAITTERHDCGTVACIGGWAAALMGLRHATDFVNYSHSPRLTALFFPPSCLMDLITPDIAAAGLRAYLTTGKADWAEALAA